MTHAMFILHPGIALFSRFLFASRFRLPIIQRTMTESTREPSIHQQPPWQEPTVRTSTPILHVYNTLTRTKVPFHPESGDNRIRWYSCGPTVYDAAHLGHARNYVTFDILRRILQDYFNYDIMYIMNITDIDDKIILRARQAFLLKEFAKANPIITERLISELRTILHEFGEKKVKKDLNQENWFVSAKSSLSPDDAKGLLNIETAFKSQVALNKAIAGEQSKDLIDSLQDILSPHLDELKGATVNDPQVSRDLAAFWEADFLQDMKQLGVIPVDVLTRVSEYIPEIIDCVQGILKNGFAYVTADGSVYFDAAAFESSPKHHYAKLCPWNAGNAKFFEEGEGALGIKLSGKRDPRDFALWKASKSGEPFWDSPWGKGRPGWHIECSAMAGAVAPGILDIHSGGIDLAFPHHDNELAQAEASTGCTQWVNYFLHAGHVHIEGHKMSKSLKNFITIKECLREYSARQMRLMFLQHQWNASVTFKKESMSNAVSAEASFTNFLTVVAQHQKEYVEPGNGNNNFDKSEKALMEYTDKIKDAVHAAFCDSFDTPSVVASLLDLVNKANVYFNQKGPKSNPNVLVYAAKYVCKILNILGINGLPEIEGSETKTAGINVDSSRLNGILTAISDFRDEIRVVTKSAEHKPKDYFAASDVLRSQLAKLGVIFEDRSDGQRSIVKMVDPKIIDQASNEEEGDLSEKAAALSLKQKQSDRASAKLAKSRISPSELFLGNPEFSKLDERGVPTHDAFGEELSKSARKKLLKEYEQQVQLYAKH